MGEREREVGWDVRSGGERERDREKERFGGMYDLVREREEKIGE